MKFKLIQFFFSAKISFAEIIFFTVIAKISAGNPWWLLTFIVVAVINMVAGNYLANSEDAR